MSAPKAPYLRFLESYTVCPERGCWLWTGARQKTGYGWLKVFGETVRAHRFSYELHKGPIPEGMHVLHSCDVRNCVNPDHLRAATHQDNMSEAAERGRMRSGAAHHMHGKRNPRPMQAKPVRVLGRSFPSQREAERFLNLGQGTVRYWIKNSPEKAQYISTEE